MWNKALSLYRMIKRNGVLPGKGRFVGKEQNERKFIYGKEMD